MKALTTTLSLLFFLTACLTTYGQDSKPRTKYRNISYSMQTLSSRVDNVNLNEKNNFGAAFTTGRTYFVHKTPILGMIRFGVDATWFDINYNNYSVLQTEHFDDETSSIVEKGIHQAEISVHTGPSVTINPISKLNVHLYFRYAPTFSGLYQNGSFLGNYASYFVTGGSVSYGVIGLGVEARFGSCNYNELFKLGDDDGFLTPSISGPLKTSGMRAYVSFRF